MCCAASVYKWFCKCSDINWFFRAEIVKPLGHEEGTCLTYYIFVSSDLLEGLKMIDNVIKILCSLYIL